MREMEYLEELTGRYPVLHAVKADVLAAYEMMRDGIGPYKIQCQCRKPGTGMFEMAEGRFDVDKAHSFMVGDKLLDVEAGKNYGLASILVGTGYGREQHEEDMKTGLSPAYDFYAETLPDAARWILGKGQV